MDTEHVEFERIARAVYLLDVRGSSVWVNDNNVAATSLTSTIRYFMTSSIFSGPIVLRSEQLLSLAMHPMK